MNKYIEVEKCKIMMHIYNIKTYHKDTKVVNTIIDIIISVYVRESLLTVTCEKVHQYLGMTIELSKKGKGKFTICMTTLPT